MKKAQHYLKLLGLATGASLADLKSAYRNKMKDCHPDKFQDNEEEKLQAEARSKKIIEAYHFLVSIAPETIAAGKEQYLQTLLTGIDNYEYKNEILKIDFADGNTYEYFDVPKKTYSNFVNAPSPIRFMKRHISMEFVYRSVNRLVAS